MSSSYRVLVFLGKGHRNYSAYTPEIPGCVATGASAEETLCLMGEALQLHPEGTAEDGDEMPISAEQDDEAHFLEVEVRVPANTLHQTS